MEISNVNQIGADNGTRADTLSLYVGCVSESDAQKLHKLIASKGELMKKALGCTSLVGQYCPESDSFRFIIIAQEIGHEIIASASVLFSASHKFVHQANRVSDKSKTVANDRYAFRCFLNRIGLSGDEFKTERRFMLKNLTGSSAYKDCRDVKSVALQRIEGYSVE